MIREPTFCAEREESPIMMMPATPGSRTRHFSIATLARDGVNHFGRIRVSLVPNDDTYRYVFGADAYNENLYRTMIKMYCRSVDNSIAPIIAVERPSAWKQYLKYLYHNQRVPFGDVLLDETTIGRTQDVTLTNCPCCLNQHLAHSTELVPLILLHGHQKKTISTLKNRCTLCKITFSQTNLRSGFVEVNGTAYSAAFLKHIADGTLLSGNFSATYKTQQQTYQYHTTHHDVLIAYRFFQDMILPEDQWCPVCGPEPEILFGDGSGKHKIDINVQPITNLEQEFFAQDLLPPDSICYAEYWENVILSRMINAVTRDPAIREAFRFKATYMQAPFLSNPKILGIVNTPSTTWTKRYNRSRPREGQRRPVCSLAQ